MSDTLIGLLSAVIGAVVGALGTYFTLRFNYKSLYAQVVSQSRNNWLNEMRKYISQMLAAKKSELDYYAANLIGNLPNNPTHVDKYQNEYNKARNEVRLRLNLREVLHVKLAEEIEGLDNLSPAQAQQPSQAQLQRWSKRFKNIEEEITNISQQLLKIEWDRVRKEAKGEK